MDEEERTWKTRCGTTPNGGGSAPTLKMPDTKNLRRYGKEFPPGRAKTARIKPGGKFFWFTGRKKDELRRRG